MNNEKKIKTKSGYCHILKDKIVLSREGVIGNLANITAGKTISRIIFLYAVACLFSISFAIIKFIENDYPRSIFFLLFALFVIYGMINSINNSATLEIDRKSIQKINFTRGITGLTRPRFEVIFTDKNGKTKKRLIMLRDSWTGGQTEAEMVYQLFVEENLIKK